MINSFYIKGASEISINKKISFEIECPICFLVNENNCINKCLTLLI